MNSTNTRYFYTDPLAAAWMAKHFGMRFYCDTFEPFEYEGANDILQDMGEDEKACVHPDSLHLLEPQVGDLMRGSNNTAAMYFTGEVEPKPTAHIVQRNGKPFHWPEREVL